MDSRRKIGSVGVDSGQLMIVDPCYIEGTWNNNSYDEICDTTISDPGYGPVLSYPKSTPCVGFALSTGGDGEFDVYGIFRHDELIKIEIVPKD